MLGNRNAVYLEPFRHEPERFARLDAVLHEPSLYDRVVRLLARRGLPVDPGAGRAGLVAELHAPTPVVVEAWLVVYREPDTHWDLYELGEDLLDLEDAMRQWRLRHVTTVERIIGLKIGTGGTAGVPYLRERLQLVLFPELWDVRTRALWRGRTRSTCSARRAPSRRRCSRPPIRWRAAATASWCPTAWPTSRATRSGCSPRAARAAVDDVLGAWSSSAVDAHLEGDHPWAPYHETMRETVATLVGACSGEAVVMNSLTVNLHLMLRSFYRPTSERYRIVIEADVFPSDRYALMDVARAHGLDPADAVVILSPRPGDRHLRTEDVAGYLEREGGSVAVVVLSAVDFRTGALLDLPAITDAAHRAGAFMGWDLAHAAGNVPVALHDWDVDFAVWCHYKYVNSGPGAVGGCFVHERHGTDPSLVRPGGWWGHDPVSRFDMPFGFAPVDGAEGWQMSNPPILAMAPVRVSLALFAEVGLDRLRDRSVRLTAFLERLFDAVAGRRPIEVITPRDPERRGAQLSVIVDDAAAVTEDLFARHRVRADDRPPNIIRLAPAPLYNTYEDCWRAAVALDDVLA